MSLVRHPRTGRLMIESVAAAALARRYGTPLYVYSLQALVENFRRIRDAFAPVDALVAFSVKSNSTQAVLRALIREGAGLDIVSGGELARGLRAGADPGKIIFAGVGKTEDEIRAALEAGILAFNVESEPEIEAIARVARRLRRIAPVALRVNPDVDAATHHYIATGRKETKFGIPFDAVGRLARRLARVRSVRLMGLHCHIGSQILRSDVYEHALERMAELVARLRRAGLELETLNLGGGFGIAYRENQQALDPAAVAQRLLPILQALGLRVIFEPGRAIAGPAGVLLTRVLYVKNGAHKRFVIVDAAMNDLIRPSLYDAYHRIVPDRVRSGRGRVCDVVGPVCETGDFLGKDRDLPPLQAGDLLAVADAGAYGMTMASNYNSRPRPAEVLVHRRRHDLIARRETIDDLAGRECIPDYLA